MSGNEGKHVVIAGVENRYRDDVLKCSGKQMIKRQHLIILVFENR